MIPEDGAIDASLGSTERMVCEIGFTFEDGSEYEDITCIEDTGGQLLWYENIPECEGGLFMCLWCITG